jgi:alkanesulfonate monooxygenase SsuD/methylene tetrahydromethanopterin reductase-like flavin-dependent oxidoreductase (luciferase family)
MELGAYSFGSREISAETGKPVSSAQAMRDMLEGITLAEQVGLDYFGIGEHHKPGMPASSPGTMIAAAAAVTSRIRLGSSIVVLGGDDPVRLFQQFATADAISGGRVEITAGRGASVEPFTLFGHDLSDYDELFAEKFDLLDQLNRNETITWHGRFRPPLDNAEILPRPEQARIPLWVATGGNPTSILRAARHRARLFLSVFGSRPAGFTRLADLYRQASAEAGTPAEDLRIGVASVGLITERADAVDYWGSFFTGSTGEANGSPIPQHVYDEQVVPGGGFFVGHPEEIAERIVVAQSQIGHDRQIFGSDFGGLPHRDFLRNIELLGTVVKPLVDRELGTFAH